MQFPNPLAYNLLSLIKDDGNGEIYTKEVLLLIVAVLQLQAKIKADAKAQKVNPFYLRIILTLNGYPSLFFCLS